MPKAAKGKMTSDRFAEILADKDWAQIQQMVTALDNAGYWDEIEEDAIARFKKEHCRQMARTLRREDGRHVFVHVKKMLPDGNKIDLYKQQALFDVDDYRFAVNYHRQMGFHHMARANQLARDCRTFIGKQIPLPFPGIASDSAA